MSQNDVPYVGGQDASVEHYGQLGIEGTLGRCDRRDFDVACQPRPVTPIINAMSRRFQFSLTTMLWLMLVVAAFLGALGIGQQRASRIELLLRAEADRSRAIAEESLRTALAAEQRARQQAAATQQ